MVSRKEFRDCLRILLRALFTLRRIEEKYFSSDLGYSLSIARI